MGEEPHGLVCEDIIDSKWYICEARAYGPSDPWLGCGGPDWGECRAVFPGNTVSLWICNNLSCVFGWHPIAALGDTQKLLKVFGPYDTQVDALMDMW